MFATKFKLVKGDTLNTLWNLGVECADKHLGRAALKLLSDSAVLMDRQQQGEVYKLMQSVTDSAQSKRLLTFVHEFTTNLDRNKHGGDPSTTLDLLWKAMKAAEDTESDFILDATGESMTDFAVQLLADLLNGCCCDLFRDKFVCRCIESTTDNCTSALLLMMELLKGIAANSSAGRLQVRFYFRPVNVLGSLFDTHMNANISPTGG